MLKTRERRIHLRWFKSLFVRDRLWVNETLAQQPVRRVIRVPVVIILAFFFFFFLSEVATIRNLLILS